MTRRRIAELITITLVGLCAGWLMGQTSCTASTPCVGLTFNNPNSPSTNVILSCVGSSTICNQAALNYYISKQTFTNICPSVNSPWKCTAFKQTKSPQGYNFPAAMGSTMNFSFEWFTPAGAIQQTVVAALQ